MRTSHFILIAACAAVAGCNPKSGANAVSGQAAQPAASAPSGPASIADDQMPHLKPGLWEITSEMTIDGKSMFASRPDAGMPKMQMCIDQTYDTNKSWREQMKQVPPECAKPTMTRRPDGRLDLHMSCAPKAGKPLDMDGVISGDFTSTYKVDMTTSGMDEKGAKHVVHMVMTQSRIGDCAPGQKAGALTMMAPPSSPKP